MSIHGKVGRYQTVLAWDFHQSIYEDRLAPAPGWSLRITIPWIDILLKNAGTTFRQRIRVTPRIRWDKGQYVYVYGFGYWLELSGNGNTPRQYATGDAGPILYGKDD